MKSAVTELKQHIAQEVEAGMIDMKFCVGVASGKASAEAAAEHVLDIMTADKEGKTREYADY